MKNSSLALLLALLLVFLMSGCATRTTVSGGPTIDIPPTPASTSSKAGILARMFSPNNMAVYVNSTEFIIVLHVSRIPFDQYTRRIIPGQITNLNFRNLIGNGKVVVVISAYDSLTGAFLGATSDRLSLTDDGGNPRMFNRVIGSRLSRGNRVIYVRSR